MADGGFQVVAVAIDEDADKIRPFTEGVTYPVLLDADHVVTELYAISNVPTVATEFQQAGRPYHGISDR